jgi:hypothetical protein
LLKVSKVYLGEINMPTNNERATRKAIVEAFGGTGTVGNERDFNKSLITAVSGSFVKSKPAVIALVSLTGTPGTANDAMTALAASTAAASAADTATLPTKASVDAIIVATNNNFADLQAKVNAIIAALKA